MVDPKIEELTNSITSLFANTLAALIERRDSQYALETAALDAERESLAQEAASIAEASANLEKILLAQARVAQREADELLIAGKADEAQIKLEEAQQAANAPAAMEGRQREIQSRIEAIQSEKLAIARRVFESYFRELQHVIRASEHGLFIELLNKSREEMYAFQNRHGLVGTLDKPGDFLIKDSHLTGLTAPERSDEWTAGNRWYRGRA